MDTLTTPFIIADVGSNWRRYDDPGANLNCALTHIRLAAQCGVSAVKFQLFTHEELYGTPGDNTYALPAEWLPALSLKCKEEGVEFMCTAFSVEGYRRVDPFVNAHKVASAEMMHEGILEAVSGMGKPWIVSTGGATEEDVSWLADWDDGRLTILECVASYPAWSSDYNLRAMAWWAKTYGVRVGVSDHTVGDDTLSGLLAIAAVGAGATVFEKHFYAHMPGCADKWPDVEMPWTPDRSTSSTRKMLADYVQSIRTGFSALGDGIKRPSESEADFVKYARRPRGMDTFRRKAP